MELNTNCIQCDKRDKTPDTGAHLYINKKTRLFYCQRCGWSGKWRGDLPKVDIASRPRLLQRNVELITFDILNKESTKVFEYCCKRLPEEIVRERVRWSPTMTTRAFFPVWFMDEVNMWQARTIYDTKPKYLNYGGVSKYLYNFENVKDWAVLCEGPFDALASPHGIALFGKNISQTQFDMMRSKYTKIYWALDGDTKKDKKIQEFKEKLMKDIEVIDIDFAEHEDPSSIGYEEMERRM